MLVFDGVPSVVSDIDSVVSFAAMEHLRLVMVTSLCMSYTAEIDDFVAVCLYAAYNNI